MEEMIAYGKRVGDDRKLILPNTQSDLHMAVLVEDLQINAVID